MNHRIPLKPKALLSTFSLKGHRHPQDRWRTALGYMRHLENKILRLHFRENFYFRINGSHLFVK